VDYNEIVIPHICREQLGARSAALQHRRSAGMTAMDSEERCYIAAMHNPSEKELPAADC
jgi:hypothetical protein